MSLRLDAISVLRSRSRLDRALILTHSRTFSTFAFTRSKGIRTGGVSTARESHAFFTNDSCKNLIGFLRFSFGSSHCVYPLPVVPFCAWKGRFFRKSIRHVLHCLLRKMAREDLLEQCRDNVCGIYCWSLGHQGCRRNGILTTVARLLSQGVEDLRNFTKVARKARQSPTSPVRSPKSVSSV